MKKYAVFVTILCVLLLLYIIGQHAPHTDPQPQRYTTYADSAFIPRDDPTPRPTVRPTARPAALPSAGAYILNTSTKKFHKPSCSSVRQMLDKNKRSYSGDREALIAMGYSPCGKCHP